MTSVFDGLAGALNSVFGAPVSIYPGGGAAVEIRAVLRDAEVEVVGEDAEPVLTTQPTLRAIAADVAALEDGDRVVAGGRDFRVRYRLPVESPATDRFEAFVLKEV